MAAFSYISKFLLNVRDNAKTGFKSELTLFFRDEKGAVEPHAELLSTALAVIGFVVLAALLSHTYQGYEARSFALENYETASVLAQTIAEAPALFSQNPNVLSASALDKLSGRTGAKEREKFFATFSENYRFFVEVRTEDRKWHWKIVPNDLEPDFFIESKEKVASSVPVVIEINPAQAVPGTLSVILYKTAWI